VKTMPAWEPRRVAVRAHTQPHKTKPGGTPPAPPRPRSMLVLDCETRTDPAQPLLFGSYRYYRLPFDGTPRCMQEGLFTPDDLSVGERAIVERYAATRTPQVCERGDPQLHLHSLEEFLEHVVFRAAFKAGAVIVGFNLPFDLSRLAWDCSPAKDAYQGGFSLSLFSYRDEDGEQRESGHRPRLKVKTLDAKRQLISFGSVRNDDGDDRSRGPVQLLDLHTLAFALTNRSHSLASACEAFNVAQTKTETERHGVLTPAYIDYNRADVAATGGLYDELMREYRRHPIALPASQAYSPAGIGRSYLRAMGIQPVIEHQPDFPPEWLGRSMVAYYGGRCEAHIRRTPVPVIYTDFLSMYPTVNSLMGLWALITAARIDIEDVTEETQRLLDTVTVADCFDPAMWRKLVGLVELQPDGDVLPVRVPYVDGADSYQISVNPLRADETLWYATPDALSAALLAGKAPRIPAPCASPPSACRTVSKPSTSPARSASTRPATTSFAWSSNNVNASRLAPTSPPKTATGSTRFSRRSQTPPATASTPNLTATTSPPKAPNASPSQDSTTPSTPTSHTPKHPDRSAFPRWQRASLLAPD